MLSMDLRRISSNKIDILCCYSYTKRDNEKDVEENSGKNNNGFNAEAITTLNNASQVNNVNIKDEYENKTEKHQQKMTVASVMMEKNLDSRKHLVVKEKCYAHPHELHLSVPNNGATVKPDKDSIVFGKDLKLPFDMPDCTLAKFAKVYYAEWVNRKFMKLSLIHI